MDDQSRNLILATALSFLVLLGWFVLGPILFPDAFPTEEPAPATQTAPDATVPPAPGAAPAPAPEAAAAPQTREAALAASPRLPIRTARVSGSLSLLGARIDDLSLSDYTVTVEPGSPTVTLLQPPG
ncbi:membrane protein insertase YidC, partial [uncultured Amaricoccus sp.]